MRLDPRDFTDPYITDYAWVPPAGAGVCYHCHTGPSVGYTTCYSCEVTRAQVRHPADLVVPISLYEMYSQLHTVLRQYKDSHSSVTRNRFTTQVSATLARFISQHRRCIESTLAADITLATTVPSSAGRIGVHPLATAVHRISYLREITAQTLRPGPTPIKHLKASDTGYEVIADVAGHVVLLIDDTFTSGARAQSAASALHLSGAAKVAVVVVGRVINPSWNSNCEAICGRRDEFSFEVCCLE
jgi:hypothetical protein